MYNYIVVLKLSPGQVIAAGAIGKNIIRLLILSRHALRMAAALWSWPDCTSSNDLARREPCFPSNIWQCAL